MDTIDPAALKAALSSDAYRCPGCDDGELRAEVPAAGREEEQG